MLRKPHSPPLFEQHPAVILKAGSPTKLARSADGNHPDSGTSANFGNQDWIFTAAQSLSSLEMTTGRPNQMQDGLSVNAGGICPQLLSALPRHGSSASCIGVSGAHEQNFSAQYPVLFPLSPSESPDLDANAAMWNAANLPDGLPYSPSFAFSNIDSIHETYVFGSALPSPTVAGMSPSLSQYSLQQQQCPHVYTVALPRPLDSESMTRETFVQNQAKESKMKKKDWQHAPDIKLEHPSPVTTTWPEHFLPSPVASTPAGQSAPMTENPTSSPTCSNVSVEAQSKELVQRRESPHLSQISQTMLPGLKNTQRASRPLCRFQPPLPSPCFTQKSIDDPTSSTNDTQGAFDVNTPPPLNTNRQNNGRVPPPTRLSEQKEAGESRNGPYSQLIYQALLSAPEHTMTLQDIYQWFRANTDRARAGDPGWKGSVRHNLSMNDAFINRKQKTGGPEKDSKAAPKRHASEWVLSPRAVAEGGPEPTTRYRKGKKQARGQKTNGHATPATRHVAKYLTHQGYDRTDEHGVRNRVDVRLGVETVYRQRRSVANWTRRQGMMMAKSEAEEHQSQGQPLPPSPACGNHHLQHQLASPTALFHNPQGSKPDELFHHPMEAQRFGPFHRSAAVSSGPDASVILYSAHGNAEPVDLRDYYDFRHVVGVYECNDLAGFVGQIQNNQEQSVSGLGMEGYYGV